MSAMPIASASMAESDSFLSLMTNTKKNRTKVPESTSKSNEPKTIPESTIPNPSSGPDYLPMTAYISAVGVHTTLWSFVALYLPRTQLLGDFANLTWDSTPVSSRDRPQHPFLDALTMNPTATLVYICVGAVVLQSWWAGYLRDWWLRLGVRGTEEERKTEIALLNRQKSSIARKAWTATIAASFVIHCVLLFFGAPITSLTLKTYLLALLISVTAVFPPAYAIGIPTLGNNSASIVQRWTWVRLFVEFSSRNPVERALVYPAIGTVLGCWLGVIPIALDWDRPWQAWPLTPAFGAISGYVLSSIIALTVNSIVDLAEQHAKGQLDAAEQKKTK